MERGMLLGTHVQNVRGQFKSVKQRAAISAIYLDGAAVNVEYDISIHQSSTSSYNKVVFWIAPEGQLRYNASSG